MKKTTLISFCLLGLLSLLQNTENAFADKSFTLKDYAIMKTICPDSVLQSGKVDPFVLCYVMNPVYSNGDKSVYYINTDKLDATSLSFVEALFTEANSRGGIFVEKTTVSVTTEDDFITTPIGFGGNTQWSYRLKSVRGAGDTSGTNTSPSSSNTSTETGSQESSPNLGVKPSTGENKYLVTQKEFTSLKKKSFSLIVKKLKLTKKELTELAKENGMTKYTGTKKQNDKLKKAIIERMEKNINITQ